MIAKEWRDARWKLLVGAVLVLAMGALIPVDTLSPSSYALFGEPNNVVAPSPEEDAEYLRYLLWGQWFTEASGNLILMMVAAVLGAGLVSEETKHHPLASEQADQSRTRAAHQIYGQRWRSSRHHAAR
jgi:hypothetical protein